MDLSSGRPRVSSSGFEDDEEIGRPPMAYDELVGTSLFAVPFAESCCDTTLALHLAQLLQPPRYGYLRF